MLLLALISSYLKFVLVLTPLVGLFDFLCQYIFSKVLLASFGANSYTSRFHWQHKDFNYQEHFKGIQVVNHGKYISARDKTIILSNEASLIDFVYLNLLFAP